MDHFAGMDVSVKETSVCILDDTGKILKEVKMASEPQALLEVLGNPAYHFKRIGLEAGPLSQWASKQLKSLNPVRGCAPVCAPSIPICDARRAPSFLDSFGGVGIVIPGAGSGSTLQELNATWVSTDVGFSANSGGKADMPISTQWAITGL